MKFIRRVLLALSVASAVAGVLRFKGKGTAEIKQGGWRKITGQKYSLLRNDWNYWYWCSWFSGC